MLFPKSFDFKTLKWADFKATVAIFDKELSKNDQFFTDFQEFCKMEQLFSSPTFQELSLSKKWMQILKNENFEVLSTFFETVHFLTYLLTARTH